MIRRRNLPPLLLLLAASPNQTLSQQPPKPQPPIGDALYQIFDSNKDQKVTMPEVTAQLAMLELLMDQSADMDEAGRENKKYLSSKKMFAGVKAAAPTLFNLLDSNSDQKLMREELEYVTKFENSLKKDGGMRELLRDVFGIIDTNKDDQLSADEVLDAAQSDQVLTDVTVLVHKLFPLRDMAAELEEFVKKVIDSIGGKDSLDKASVEKGIKWIDDDEDGFISRKEVGKYYNMYGKMFIETSKAVKALGPMLNMFGNSDLASMFGAMGGAGGMPKMGGAGMKKRGGNANFKTDL